METRPPSKTLVPNDDIKLADPNFCVFCARKKKFFSLHRTSTIPLSFFFTSCNAIRPRGRNNWLLKKMNKKSVKGKKPLILRSDAQDNNGDFRYLKKKKKTRQNLCGIYIMQSAYFDKYANSRFCKKCYPNGS